MLLWCATYATPFFAHFLVVRPTVHKCSFCLTIQKCPVTANPKHRSCDHTFRDACFHPWPIRYVRSHRPQSLETKMNTREKAYTIREMQ